MWLIVMFDLPTDSKPARRSYSDFRNFLLEDGFVMMQYSIYMRHSASEENATVHAHRVKRVLPPDGEIRIIKITDKQFGRIEVFYGRKAQKTRNQPANALAFLTTKKHICQLIQALRVELV